MSAVLPTKRTCLPVFRPQSPTSGISADSPDTRIVRLDPMVEQTESQTPEPRRYRAGMFSMSARAPMVELP